MGKLIDVDAVKKRFPIMENDFGMVINERLHKELDKFPPVEAIPKAEYEARLTELRSMTLRVKHNTGSIDTLIDKLDDLLSEVQE